MEHYELLRSIAGGWLSPHLAMDEDVSPLYYHCQKYNILEYKDYMYFKVDKNFLFEYPPDILNPDGNYERKILKDKSGNNWYHPTRKAYYYYEIIDAEKTKLIQHYNSIYNRNIPVYTIDGLVQKEIHQLSKIARDTMIYTSTHIKDFQTLNLSNSNHYVISLLQETIIDLFQEIYNIFEGLINLKVISREKFKAEYFGEKPYELVNLLDKNTTIYLNHRNILKKICKEFNFDVFQCGGENDFCEIFDLNNQMEYTFKIKHKTKFCYLLYEMWENRDNIELINQKYPNRESFIKPFLEKYSCSFGTFTNKDVFHNTNAKYKSFKEKVEAMFK